MPGGWGTARSMHLGDADMTISCCSHVHQSDDDGTQYASRGLGCDIESGSLKGTRWDAENKLVAGWLCYRGELSIVVP